MGTDTTGIFLGAPWLCNKCRRQVVPHNKERRHRHSIVYAQVS